MHLGRTTWQQELVARSFCTSGKIGITEKVIDTALQDSLQ
jgi:hypothetical protein